MVGIILEKEAPSEVSEAVPRSGSFCGGLFPDFGSSCRDASGASIGRVTWQTLATVVSRNPQ